MTKLQLVCLSKRRINVTKKYSMSHLLHAEYFSQIPFNGEGIMQRLEQRALDVANAKKLRGNATVAIRALNEGAALHRLLTDVRAQQVPGELEIVVIDNESSDETPQIAHQFGAKVVTLARSAFTYPRSMNMAMEAASHDNVFLTVAHAELTTDQVLRGGLQLLQSGDKVGGAYYAPLPNAGASRWENYGGSVAGLFMRPRIMRRHMMGMLGATGAMINRQAWKQLGGFDERYESGGEDGDLAKRMLAAGYTVFLDPVVAVHHAHGLNLRNTIQQWQMWRKTAHPVPLDKGELAARRPDLNLD